MKILEIIFWLAPGGGERFVVDLSNELSKTNDVVLLTLKDETVDTEYRTFYKSEISSKVQYRNLGLGNGFRLKNLWKIYKEIKKVNADVVHFHLGNMPKFCMLAILLLHKKMKFIQTIHNDMSGYDDKFYRFYFNTIGRLHWVRFVALSQINFNDLTRMHPSVNAYCIANGRSTIKPTNKYHDVIAEISQYRLTPSTKIFLHVARFTTQKNQSLLVDSFNEFISLGYDAFLLIIGAGFDSVEGKKLLKTACNRILWLGTRKNIGDYMLNSDFFTLSSLYEGLPITLLEATLAGIPSVCTPVCGVLDLVKNGETGVISKSFCKDDFISSLISAYNNCNHLKEVASAEKNKSPYTIEHCAQEYLKFFELKNG